MQNRFRVTEIVMKPEMEGNQLTGRFKCSATLVCDKCQTKSTQIVFYYGPSPRESELDAMIWYTGKTKNKKWFRDAEFINLCPCCYNRFRKGVYKT